jgi:hypothetical protein
MNTLPLTGLNGQNPLAFLAALGALRTASRLATTPVSLAWQPMKNGWYPSLTGTADFLSAPKKATAAFHEILAKKNPALSLSNDANNPKIQASDFRVCAEQASGKWLDDSSPEDAAFIAALGNESVMDKDSLNKDTAFRTMSGAGNQHFLKFMRKLIAETSGTQLREALFGPWKYNDTQFSMRWAPEDDRRYALLWDNPSTDPARNVRGANRLAIEALPLFPTMPTAHALETTGFSGHKSNNTFLTWPIWTIPITIDVCGSLLAHSELQKKEPDLCALAPLGITTVFRSQRITIGNFRNFTPAQTLA